MTLEIDTVMKTIRVKGTATLKELMEYMSTAYPDFEWEQWTVLGSYDTFTSPSQWYDPNTILRGGIVTTGVTTGGIPDSMF